MNKIDASVVVLVAGIGLLLASLLADVIGIGDDAGFGNQQTMGAIAGVVLAAFGVYLMKKKTGSIEGNTEDSTEGNFD